MLLRYVATPLLMLLLLMLLIAADVYAR